MGLARRYYLSRVRDVQETYAIDTTNLRCGPTAHPLAQRLLATARPVRPTLRGRSALAPAACAAWRLREVAAALGGGCARWRLRGGYD